MWCKKLPVTEHLNSTEFKKDKRRQGKWKGVGRTLWLWPRCCRTESAGGWASLDLPDLQGHQSLCLGKTEFVSSCHSLGGGDAASCRPAKRAPVHLPGSVAASLSANRPAAPSSLSLPDWYQLLALSFLLLFPFTFWRVFQTLRMGLKSNFTSKPFHSVWGDLFSSSAAWSPTQQREAQPHSLGLLTNYASIFWREQFTGGSPKHGLELPGQVLQMV